MIGQLVGDRYKILRKIGEGGMGEVYLAEHIYIEKKVALKLLRAEVLSNQEAVARFRQEARSASSIGHDNIIQIDDFGVLRDGRVYMAMEYLLGQPLNELLARQVLPLPRALNILIQIGRGLTAAHAKGIIHRDMKPENVFVTSKDGHDVPKILDFGIAKVAGGDGSGQNLTVAGQIFGTPFYMAPEQAMGGRMDHRVDIYALGIILYEVFCGVVPFRGDSFMGILTQHITTPPAPPSQVAAQNGRVCPPELQAIILRAIQKDPGQRYQTMGEMTAALVEFFRFAVGHGPSAMVPVQAPRPPAPGARTALYAGLGATAVITLAALLALRGGSGGGGGGPDAGKAPPLRPDAARPVIPVGPPDAAPLPPDAPPAPPPRRMVKVRIESRPAGATVLLDGRIQGRAPVSVEIEEGTRHWVRLEKAHFTAEELTIDGSALTVIQPLVAEGLHRPE
jgi:serine/threonine-protein kinase